MLQSSKILNWTLALALAVSVLGAVLVVAGHYHRRPLEEQFALISQQTGRSYPEELPPWDGFNPALYYDIDSLAKAAQVIGRDPAASDPAFRLRAAYQLVEQRFIHYMYPKHDWRTNFLLAALGRLWPQSTYDAIYLGDDLLRHAAGASCGQAAGVFIELWRRLGGRARACYLPGHDVAEAMVEGRIWTVDPDLGALMPYSIDQIAAQPRLLLPYYGHLSPRQTRNLMGFYSSPHRGHFGWNDPPTSSPRIYRGQEVAQVVKLAFFPALALTAIALLPYVRRRHA
jgi:hypothetical protein